MRESLASDELAACCRPCLAESESAPIDPKAQAARSFKLLSLDVLSAATNASWLNLAEAPARPSNVIAQYATSE